jgi:hypothetical protein
LYVIWALVGLSLTTPATALGDVQFESVLDQAVLDALAGRDTDAAEGFGSLLEAPSPFVDVAALCLDTWFELYYARLSEDRARLDKAAQRTDVHVQTRWRLMSLKDEVDYRLSATEQPLPDGLACAALAKQGHGSCQSRSSLVCGETDCRPSPWLVPVDVEWNPVGAARYLALAFLPAPRGALAPKLHGGDGRSFEEAPSSAAPHPGYDVHGIRIQTWRTMLECCGTVDIVMRSSSPGVLYVDDRPVLVVDRGTGKARDAEATLRMPLPSGDHVIRFVEAVMVSRELPQLAWLPLSSGGSCAGECSASGGELGSDDQPVVRDGEPGIEVSRLDLHEWADLYQLALGGEPVGGQSGLYERALDDPRALLAWLVMACSRGSRLLDSPSVLGNLAELVEDSPHCLGAMVLALAALDQDLLELAEAVMHQARPCADTALGMLAGIRMADRRSLHGVLHRRIADARARFRRNCWFHAAYTRWATEMGAAPRLLPSGLRCPEEIDGEHRVSWSGTGETGDSGSAPKLRQVLTSMAATGASSGDWGSWLRGFQLDAGFLWRAADMVGSLGEEALAARWVEWAARHAGTTPDLRMKAGVLGGWDELPGLAASVEGTIRGYLDAHFAGDHSRVLVLDETVQRVDDNGWISSLVTQVLHVRTPQATESVGEISLPLSGELVMLSVRKADGRWSSHVDQPQDVTKETVSLPGLSPGDFLVIRTIHEVRGKPAGVGCFSLPTFLFATRDVPVFLARLVVRESAAVPMNYVSSGELIRDDHDARTRVFSASEMLPIPQDPGCPDPLYGIPRVTPVAACLDWKLVRDRWSEFLWTLCDTAPPDWLREVSARPPGERSMDEVFDVVRAVRGRIESVDASLWGGKYSEVIEKKQGNPVLATWCSLVQSGWKAQMVLVSPLGGPGVDWAIPSVDWARHVLLRISSGSEVVWLDPEAVTAQPGDIRLGLQGRPGMVLDPSFPKVFVTTPRAKDGSWWGLAVDLSVDGTVCSGSLTLSARGAARYDLDVVARTASQDQLIAVASGVVSRVLPGAQVVGVAYRPGDSSSLLVRVQVPLGASRDSLALRLPPSPGLSDSLAPGRKSPLYFAGFRPTDVRVVIRSSGGAKLATSMDSSTWSSPWGMLKTRVRKGDTRIEVDKTSDFPPAEVLPAEFHDYLDAQRAIAASELMIVRVLP